MKGENYLYFCDTTDEPNAADEAILIPASTVLGISVGAADGTVDDDALYLSCQGFVGDGNSNNQFARPIIDVTSPAGISGPASYRFLALDQSQCI